MWLSINRWVIHIDLVLALLLIRTYREFSELNKPIRDMSVEGVSVEYSHYFQWNTKHLFLKHITNWLFKNSFLTTAFLNSDSRLTQEWLLNILLSWTVLICSVSSFTTAATTLANLSVYFITKTSYFNVLSHKKSNKYIEKTFVTKT